MLERLSRRVCAIPIHGALLLCVALSGCSYATARGRQQLAYARYVKKFSHNKLKQQTKFKKVKMPAPPESKTNVNATVGAGPQSMSSGGQN